MNLDLIILNNIMKNNDSEQNQSTSLSSVGKIFLINKTLDYFFEESARKIIINKFVQ